MGEKDQNKLIIFAIAAICLCAIAAVVLYANPFFEEEQINWNVTLVGSRGETKVVTFDEIKKMPSYEGYGGFFTTVGIKHGPFKCEGVPVEDLCNLVGGVGPSNTVWVYAPDGYLMVFDYDQLKGDFNTYDPATLREVPHGDLKIVLVYKQDGAYLSDDYGRPLRIAILTPRDKLMIEGSYCVKWVDRIEVK
ncbi:MAG: molybdopterin-dependent oxidoreductase [Methanocellales archaeon]|nr:molybdopterin-dependent oxidoreductase [Methanocellales archaeon]